MPDTFSFDLKAQRAREEINDALSGMQNQRMQPMPAPQPGVLQRLGQHLNVQATPQMQQMSANVPLGGGFSAGMGVTNVPQARTGPQITNLGVNYAKPGGLSAGFSVNPAQKSVNMGFRKPFQEGGLATSIRQDPVYHDRDVEFLNTRNQRFRDMVGLPAMAKGGAWTRKEGQNPEGGLNAKGRASLKAQGHDIKPPVSAKQAKKSPKAAARRKSFCARMSGMPGPMEDENGKPTRKALSLRKWDCKAEGGPVWDKERPEDLGKPKGLSAKKKASAKRRAKAAGRPYPNLIDNMAAARKKGK